MALRGELLPQLAIVVDLAVEHDGDGAVFVVDRLISRLKVDHSETLDTEPDGTVQMRSTRVRPAMLEQMAHTLERPALDRPPVPRTWPQIPHTGAA